MADLIDQLREAAAKAGIPTYMQHSLVAYITTGRPVGDFLTAVLTNDLYGAVNRADHVNVHLLPNYVAFLQSHAPSGCWGSAEDVSAWKARRGLLNISSHTVHLEPPSS